MCNLGFGSAYYHLNPNNETLFWDRFPIALGMLSITSTLIIERISIPLGIYTFPMLQFFGAFSTIQWILSERAGVGDLRLYALVQLVPSILFPLILLVYPSRFAGTRNLVYAFICFVLAKTFESTDRLTYYATFTIFGGHTLKHIFMSVAIFFVYRYVKNRKGIERALYYLFEIRAIRKVVNFVRGLFKRE